jgi:hypothetical protein
MSNVPVTEFEYRDDIDPISGAPTIVAIPKTVRAALDGIPYNVINDLGELFQPENLREAWRIFRRNDPFDYQLEIADAILYSCLNELGWFFVVMISRQAGKNEISAFIEQYLLVYGWYFGVPVSGVKFAPVHKPQVQASIDRLEGAATQDGNGLAGSVVTKGRWKKSDGYKYHMGPPRDTNKWAFLSINPTANVASQTAFTLLEGDEAQDIDTNKWEKDAQPMANFRNATTVFYGVAWDEESHIYKAMKQAYEMEARLEKELGYRPKLVFKVDAEAVIRSGNKFYEKAYRSQLARLGENHIAILTQYKLITISTLGRFFDKEQIARIFTQTKHRWKLGPTPGNVYLFSLDVAGQEENPTTADEDTIGVDKRDSTILLIGELQRDLTIVPVCAYQWTGKAHSQQREQILAIIKHWGCAGGVCDATGIGEPLAYFLIEKLPRVEIEAYKFKAQGDENKSKLGYLAYNFVAADKLRIPEKPDDPEQGELWEELRWQIENLIRVAKKQQTINWHVPPTAKPRKVGHVPHDDVVTALFLLLRAAVNIKNPKSREATAFDRRF